MRRRYSLLTALTALVVVATSYDAYMAFHQTALPFSLQIVDAHTVLIEPIPGMPLPPPLRAGDRVDLSASTAMTRIGMVRDLQVDNRVPGERSYDLVVRRGATNLTIPVTGIAPPDTESIAGIMGAAEGALVWMFALFGGIALLAIWRGQDAPAAGLALWATAALLGFAVSFLPFDDRIGLGVSLGAWALFLLERVGFYIMAESIMGRVFTARARTLWRGSFLLLLSAAAVVAFGGPLLFVAARSAELLRSPYGFIITASYLPPIALLFAGYYHADVALRLRLRWMLWSSVVFVLGISLSNSPILGYLVSVSASRILPALAMIGFLYAVLRHRVVDVSVALSRTLVYAITTSFVLGLFALLESLVERSALGHQASLALELAVPLGLGVSLSTVHRRIDSLVDRLIFSRQYQEEIALRRFANESAFVNQPETLLDLTVEQFLLHLGAPWVALYEYTAQGYRRSRHRGTHTLPETVPTDDLALVRLRAHDSDVDLHDALSGLGREGYVFPLRARDHLLGVLVVGPRPGEHYAAEERELMAHVAHAVGASLFALRARATEEELRAARAEIETGAVRLASSTAQLDQAHAQQRASEARESKLLDALRALGVEPRVSTE